MAHIRILESEINKRGRKLNKLLLPILNDPHKKPVGWKIIRNTDFNIKIVASDKELSSDYTEWRFATFHRKFRALYFEMWSPVNFKNLMEWKLEKSYLQIYKIDPINKYEYEYISLHSDTSDHTSKNSKYKRSPHLHIKVAEEPIPKAHIALVNNYIDNVSTENEFFNIFSNCIEMIRVEILDRINN